MKISKQKLVTFLIEAIGMMEDELIPRYKIREMLGVSYLELYELETGNVEIELPDNERYKIALEVDRENKLSDIKDRVRELWEDESPNLNGLTADEIIGDEELMKNILIRVERAEGWMDNGSYWYLIDDCIDDGIKNGGQKNNG